MLLILWTFSAAIMSIAHADENWLCTSEASQVQGDHVLSCGVGEAKTENVARDRAFESAHMEFRNLCKASSNCRGHAVNVEPRRTTCAETKNGYKCYRMLVFTVSHERVERTIVKYTVAPEAQAILDWYFDGH